MMTEWRRQQAPFRKVIIRFSGDCHDQLIRETYKEKLRKYAQDEAFPEHDEEARGVLSQDSIAEILLTSIKVKFLKTENMLPKVKVAHRYLHQGLSETPIFAEFQKLEHELRLTTIN